MKQLFSFIAFLAFAMVGYGQAKDSTVIANIIVKDSIEIVTFIGVLTNNSILTETYYYEMEIIKVSKSGTSQQKQSGTLEITPGKTVDLSSSSVSIDQDGKCQVRLKIYKGPDIIKSILLEYPYKNHQ